MRRIRRGTWSVITACLLLTTGCARDAGPEAVAAEYARALYAHDLGRVYALASAQDRAVRPEAAFRIGAPAEFALTLSRHLASFVVSTALDVARDGARATVTLGLRLPDARAPAIATIVGRFDQRELNRLSPSAQAAITRQLDDLRRTGRLPVIEGQQGFELERTESGWRVHAGWTGGRQVRFRAAVEAVPLEVRVDRLHVTAPPRRGGWIAEALPLHAAVPSGAVVLAPGERVRVVVAARNVAARAITARAAHRVEPPGEEAALAMLRCPLLSPVTLAPGATDEYVSEYLLVSATSAPPVIDVTYEIRSARAGAGQ